MLRIHYDILTCKLSWVQVFYLSFWVGPVKSSGLHKEKRQNGEEKVFLEMPENKNEKNFSVLLLFFHIFLQLHFCLRLFSALTKLFFTAMNVEALLLFGRANIWISDQIHILPNTWKLECAREVDVNKRTVTTHSCSLLYIGDNIWPLYGQLSMFYLFYWPHLSLN